MNNQDRSAVYTGNNDDSIIVDTTDEAISIWDQVENMMAAEITVGEVKALRDEIDRLRLELEAVRQASHDSMWRDTLVPLAEASGVPLVGPDGNKRQFQMVEDLAAEYQRQQAESRERALEYVSLDGQYMELSDELTHLRSLITAWADAWDEQATDTQGEGSYHEVTVRRIDTGDALRKAVGR